MNCAECRENLIAFAEGVLVPGEMTGCKAHLEHCADCRAEHAAISSLQQKLIAEGQAAAEVAMVEPVMRRVVRTQRKDEGNRIMNAIMKYRWGFGLGTAGVAAAVVAAALLTPSGMQAAAIQVMAKGAQAAAKLQSIHLRGQVRTAPADNFSAIMPGQEFVQIELWKQFEPDVKWRVDKPGRIAVMDGQSTMLLIKPDHALKLPQASSSAFDTQWLHEMADLNRTLTSELSAIKAKGWPVKLTQQRDASGKATSTVEVEAKPGVSAGDYLKNKFFSTADTRRVYVFDDQTERLESVQIYLHSGSEDKLVFALDQIDYNQPIDPAVFSLQLPANVTWQAERMQTLPDNAKYAAMTPEQAARAFFEACASGNWDEAGKFFPVPDRLKQYLGGLEVISVGQTFTSSASDAQFVPYEIKLKSGGVKKWNLALKRDAQTQRWFVDGGI